MVEISKDRSVIWNLFMLLNIREDVFQQNIIVIKNHEMISLMLHTMKTKPLCFYIALHFQDK